VHSRSPRARREAGQVGSEQLIVSDDSVPMAEPRRTGENPVGGRGGTTMDLGGSKRDPE